MPYIEYFVIGVVSSIGMAPFLAFALTRRVNRRKSEENEILAEDSNRDADFRNFLKSNILAEFK